MNEYIKVTGKLKVTLTDPDGTEHITDYTNNIMVNGKVLIAKWISNQKPLAPNFMAVGTETAAVNPSQTKLESEVYRKAVNSSINEGSKAIIDCMYGQGEAIGSLKEAGLFTENNVMFARALIDVQKGIYQNLTISWEVTVS